MYYSSESRRINRILSTIDYNGRMGSWKLGQLLYKLLDILQNIRSTRSILSVLMY